MSPTVAGEQKEQEKKKGQREERAGRGGNCEAGSALLVALTAPSLLLELIAAS